MLPCAHVPRTYTRLVKLRTQLNKAAAAKLSKDEQAAELALTRRAAKRLRDALTPPDELAHARLMEQRAKGSFTRKLGAVIMQSGISPLEFLIREMRDVANDKALRVTCAVQALPYLHAKIATETVVSATPGSTVNFFNVQQQQLETLSQEEFDQLCAITDKLTPSDAIEVEQ